ncbi:MAG: single-stranded DNA-binding protein [bacterium]|nr:single-stranded DNA-binding protein [bacterium]
MDLNKVTLIGNVSKNPEQTKIESGAIVTKLNLATNYKWKDTKTGEKKEKADFHTIVAWNKLAENMTKFLKKGDKVYIEGRINNRSFEAKDGTTKYFTDIVAQKMIMLGGKQTKKVNEDEEILEETVEEVAF